MKVYKYKSFNTYTADLLTDIFLYFSDPMSFNDPLEVEWNLNQDIDIVGAMEVLAKLNENTKQISNFDLWLNNLKSSVADRAEYYIDEGGFESINYDKLVAEIFEAQILAEIKKNISKSILNYGVLSLSGRWDSPLMWSHYADAHRGICIEYTCDEKMNPKPKAVDYDRPKEIYLSDIRKAIVESSQSAIDLIIDRYYFTKANDWRYEEEMRLLGPCGDRRGEYYIKNTAIYFGSRCPKSTIIMVASTLKQRPTPPSFYEVSFDTRSMKMLSEEFGEEAFMHYRASDGFPFPPIDD